MLLSARASASPWQDMLWGYKRRYIGWSDVVTLAVDWLLAGSENPTEIELAGLGKSDTQQIGELLRAPAHAESGEEPSDVPVDDEPDDEEWQTPTLSSRKWLFVVHSRLYENRAAYADPLWEVWRIQDDFDYPEELEGFKYFITQADDDPSQHSPAEIRARTYAKWEQYLVQTRNEIGIPE